MPRKSRPTLKELVDTGYLTAGEQLTCVHSKGAAPQTASLDEHGHITHGNESYDKPSAWVQALAGGNRNGWQYVRRLSDNRTLDSICNDALRARRESSGTPPIEARDTTDPESADVRDTPDSTDMACRTELLDRISELSPSQFEALVAKFLEAKGLEDVEVTGRSNDGGIDGKCSLPFLNLRIA